MNSDQRFQSGSKWVKLTPREQQILTLLMAGRSNKWTAYELGISQRTVESHRSSIYRKYEVNNALQLFAEVQRETWQRGMQLPSVGLLRGAV